MLGSFACSFDSSGVGSQAGMGQTESSAVETETSSTRGADADGAETAMTASATSDPFDTSDETDDAEDTHATSSETGEDEIAWCDVVDLDLVGCYDFQEIAQGALSDGSAHGNDGTIEGVAVVAGPFGQAIAFGEHSRVAVPDSPSLDLTDAMTLELWMRVDELPTSSRMGVLDNDGQYSIFLYAGEGLRCSGSGHSLFLEPVPTNTWIHVACVAGNGVHRMYVDAKLVAETAFSGPMNTGNTNPLAIGDDSPGFDQPLAGAIGGVRIWSRPLDEAELCAAAGRCGT
jgi:hypothetical protein